MNDSIGRFKAFEEDLAFSLSEKLADRDIKVQSPSEVLEKIERAGFQLNEVLNKDNDQLIGLLKVDAICISSYYTDIDQVSMNINIVAGEPASLIHSYAKSFVAPGKVKLNKLLRRYLRSIP